MLLSQRRLMVFRTTRLTFCIPRGYTFICYKVQRLLASYDPNPNLDGGSQEFD